MITGAKKKGTYLLYKNSFFIGSEKYCIKERVKVTTKPKKYLIKLKPKFEYISSLFPIDENKYQLDTKDHLYTMTLKEKQIEIEVDSNVIASV